MRMGNLIRSRFAPLLATAAAAVAARAAVLSAFSQTPLDFYVKLETLDMKFIASQGESLYHLGASLTAHRLLCAATMPFTGGTLSPTAVALAQMALGTLSALLICDAAMRISGSRLAGLASGLLAATYAPALMYETLTLKEASCLFMAALSLWTALLAGRGGSKAWTKALHGIAAAGMPLARAPGILWSALSLAWLALRAAGRRRSGAWIPAAALLAAFALTWAFNWGVAGDKRLFETNIGYNMKVAASESLKSFSVDDKSLEAMPLWSLLLKAVAQAPGKALLLLNAGQPPDNVNYYFMKEALPPLKTLPGPMLLVPLGLAGLLLGLLKARGILRKEALPALQFAAFAVPICFFVVTGRHMLALMPALAVGAGLFASGFAVACREAFSTGKLMRPALMAAALSLLAWNAIPSTIPLRADDFIAYGLASGMKHGQGKEAGECFAKALILSPDSVPAAVNLGKWLIDAGRPDAAAEILRGFHKRHPGNFKILINFTTALLMSGKAAEAEAALESFQEPLSEEQAAKVRYNLKEARRLLGKDPVK